MESITRRKERAARIYELLHPLYTTEKTALEYRTPFQLLVATILSAQCTDKQVNLVTKDLFEKYRTPEDYVKAPIAQLEADIRPTGFYKNKAKALKGCCEGLLNLYAGEVPATMEELLKLPGVGRKTANCVLGAAFNIPGVVVDTHVKRLAVRLGLTRHEDPGRIETELQQLLPPDRWRRFSDLLIYHGRAVCRARRPLHDRCVIAPYCPSNHI